ncbi:MAG: coproporphyrinogen III oxidase family protein [Lachnospiraceae bacterium]|nr:coproporphyrinogen III oxidase family protein [Lachnospiraceae bacterium]
MYTSRYRSHHDASRSLKIRYTSEMPKEIYLQEKLNAPANSKRVIYIHVPFCNKVCSFCPFHRPDELRRREYHTYLLQEIERVKDYPYMQAHIDAINFGGGTPTALLPEQMDEVLTALQENFVIAPGAEVSVETSATELSEEMLRVLKKGGVNRLSVGIQSFDDEARRMLGRRGNGEHAKERVKRAIEYGFTNTSIDLIYNYPGQTQERLAKDLEQIVSLGVAGLSFYALMLHEKTPLYDRLSSEQKQEMLDVQKEYRLFSMIVEELGKDGFAPLELTKLVRDGLDRYDYMNIRHSGGSCIALGHGAGGNIEEYIYHNSVNSPLISEDIRLNSRGRVVQPVYRIIDALIYDMQKGQIGLADYSKQLGRDLEAELADLLQEFTEAGFLEKKAGRRVMTTQGLFWGNNMIDSIVRRL